MVIPTQPNPTQPRPHPLTLPQPTHPSTQCTTTGTACTTCTWGRSLLSGRCSLNCKRMFGIGCVACNSSYCTKTDPIYANGR